MAGKTLTVFPSPESLSLQRAAPAQGTCASPRFCYATESQHRSNKTHTSKALTGSPPITVASRGTAPVEECGIDRRRLFLSSFLLDAEKKGQTFTDKKVETFSTNPNQRYFSCRKQKSDLQLDPIPRCLLLFRRRFDGDMHGLLIAHADESMEEEGQND